MNGATSDGMIYSRRVSDRLSGISTLLFWGGLLCIPFDNLPFAPSYGWATIAPILFFLYVCFNFSSLSLVSFNKKYVLGFLIVFTLQFANLFIYGISINALIDSLETLVLGAAFYLALVVRYDVQKADSNKDGRVLYAAFWLSFLYGIAWLYASYIDSELVAFFQSIEKRYYTRLAFSFTEPSFISLNVIGVLFLYTYLMSDKKLAKKMILLGLAFLILSVLFRSSARCIVDVAVLIGLFLLYVLLRDSKHSARNALLWLVAIAVIALLFFSSSRLQAILVEGANADGSMASRLFRIQCMVYGFLNDPLAMLFGYGPGNLAIPLHSGFDQAFASYTSSYLVEVEQLRVATEVDNMYSMPFRLVSDIGLIATAVLFVLIIYKAKRKGIDPFVIAMTLWLYAQFDSYAFYSLWFIIFLIRDYDAKKMGVSYFALMAEMLTDVKKRFGCSSASIDKRECKRECIGRRIL